PLPAPMTAYTSTRALHDALPISGVEERARELGRRHVERPDDRNRRPAPEHRPGQAFDERRQHEQPHGGAHRTNEIRPPAPDGRPDRKSTRLNSSHVSTSYAVFCL